MARKTGKNSRSNSSKGRSNSSKGRTNAGNKASAKKNTGGSRVKIFGQGVQPMAVGGAMAGVLVADFAISKSVSADIANSMTFRAAKVIAPGAIGYGICKAKLTNAKTGRMIAQIGIIMSVFFGAQEAAKAAGYDFSFANMFGQSEESAKKQLTEKAQSEMGNLVNLAIEKAKSGPTQTVRKVNRQMALAVA